MERILGLEIGGTKLQFLVGDDAGRILGRHKLPVEAARGAAGIREQIERTLPGLIGGESLKAGPPAAEGRVGSIGVGFGGPVDWRSGRICRSHQIEGWSEFDLAGWLEQLTGLPVTVDNDANVAALGEARRGAGVGCSPVFYVTLGSGVGGGLVVDGGIYHGLTPGEAEIGHLRLDRSGTILEARCSGWAVDRCIRDLKREHPSSLLSQLAGATEGGEARHLAAALRGEDPVAHQLLEEVAEDLAFGLSHVVHLLHPQVLVLGGGLSGVGEPLRAATQQQLAGFVMEAFGPGPPVVLAALGEDAVPIGAIELARARLPTRS